MTAITVENISDKARDVSTAVPAALTQTGQRAYDKVVGGVQWYLEQWEDLIEEARATQHAGVEESSLKDILASLPEAKVVSDIHGRLRVRTQSLKGQMRLAEQCTAELGGIKGIDEVHVSSLTGSILVFYDKTTYESRAALMQAIGQA